MAELDLQRLLQDESFLNYCLGKNPEDVRKWESLLAEQPELQKEVLVLRSLVLQSGAAVAELEVREGVSELRARMERSEGKVRLIHLRRFAAVAASVIVLVGAGYFFFFKPETRGGLSMETRSGERRMFELPDGSTVMLNANSRISLSPNFNDSERIVELDGEGFFTVSPSAQKPFLVKTGGLDVRVLGTTFNLKAYSADSVYEASLVSGKIEVAPTGKSERMVLSPDQKYFISYRKKQVAPEQGVVAAATPVVTPLVVDSVANIATELSWTQNMLVFRDEPMTNVSKLLSRWYGVDIQMEDPTIGKGIYSGTFRNETIEDVLKSLGFSGDFEFRKEGEKIVLYKK